MDFAQFSSYVKDRVNKILQQKLESLDEEARNLKDAMSYGLMLGGKRARPFLVYATAKALGYELDKVDSAACAIECIHAYSLIHDDMPEMDNDELRRGHLTVHKQFGQDVALLAGDALQTLGFEFLSMQDDAMLALMQLKILAKNAGYAGMCGGQAIDLESEGKHLELSRLQVLHAKKTGALIRASVLMGASLLKGKDEKVYMALDNYAKDVGVAFQIWDDVLDVIGYTKILGKTAGSDISLDKSTYPSLVGIEKSKELAASKVESAIANLNCIDGDTSLLKAFANFCIKRDH